MNRIKMNKEQTEILTNKAVMYRQAKVSYKQIAKKLNSSETTIFRLVKNAMEKVRKNYTEVASHIVIMEMANLDLAEAALHNKVIDGDTSAIATLLRIQERRSKLIGLDAPTQQQVEMDIPEPIQFVYKKDIGIKDIGIKE